MPVKKVKSEKTDVKTPSRRAVTASGFSVPVFSMAGTSSGKLTLPKEIFGAKVNNSLLSQALRVYFNNQQSHHSNTKTRAEVRGSTAKMGPQKGSGRARHGSKRAPIFVGGGVALGPKPRRVRLDLPKKMKIAALISALSQRAAEKEIFGVVGLDNIQGKTKEMLVLLDQISKKGVLLVTDKNDERVVRATRNLPAISFASADQLNVLEVIKHQTLILTKEAVDKLESRVKSLGSRKNQEEEKP